MNDEVSAGGSEDQRLDRLLGQLRPQRIVVVTGAGISAESGIPSDRAEPGDWTANSANDGSLQTGDLAYFRVHPREAWAFALSQRHVCRLGAPNVAHLALAQLEREYADDFLLVTQNVDGLHLQAGNSSARTIEAHGSVEFMRPLEGEGEPELLRVPESVVCPARGQPLDDASLAALATADGRACRPHTMFVDEPHDEALYRSDTAMAAARSCDLLLVIGTSGAAAIPWHLAVHAREADAAVVVVDPEETPFAVHARNRERDGKGLWLRGPASRWVPHIVERLVQLRHGPPAPAVERVSTRARSRVAVQAGLRLEPQLVTSDAPQFEQARRLAELLAARQPRRVVIMTGAGVSAESGIPTYRGPNGYWTIGDRAPVSIREFEQDPRATWAFHLRRRADCHAAAPNPAHLRLAQLERTYADDLRLITQNIDGLHLRAGNTRACTIELHGSCDRMRAVDGDPAPIAIPAGLEAQVPDDTTLPDEVWDALVMPDRSRARPHVLWWDESYNEVQYQSESALAAGRSCDLLVVIGTSGAAAMPYAIAAAAVLDADATLIDINPEDNPYAEHARAREADGKGLMLQGSATIWVPELVAQLEALRGRIACRV